MRNWFNRHIYVSVLFLLVSFSSFSQTVKINDTGRTVTINAGGSPTSVTINRESLSATYPIEYKSVSGDYATAITLSVGDGVVSYEYVDENDVIIGTGDITMDTGPPLSEIKDSVFVALSLTDLLDIVFTNPTVANYVAFGELVHFADQSYAWSGRRGGNHLGGGRICTQPINSLNRSYGTRVIISRPTVPVVDDIRGGSNTVYNGQIYFFSSLYWVVEDEFRQILLNKSTDILGTAWTEDTLLFEVGTNGGVNETTYARFNCYGKPQHIPGTDTWIIPWYEHNGAGTWRANFFKSTDNLVTFTTHNISQSAIDQVGENYIQHIGGDTLLSLAKEVTDGILMQNVSYDLGATWTGWVNTNLGSGDLGCMPAINLSPEYGLMCVYGDRATGNMMITLNNTPASVIANPTSWTTPQILYTVAAGDDFQPLGYADIERVAQYRFMISFSEELTGGATTKLHVGDGSLENYVIP